MATNKRRFPRAKEKIPVHLKIVDKKKEFEAVVYTNDISLSGVFFSSTFFLKIGTVLDLEFKMPNDDRKVHTQGIIVREMRGEGRGAQRETGFAMRFTHFFADAKTILASAFLIAELDNFLEDFLTRRSRRPKNETAGLRDVIIAWEVGKMELKEGELDIMRDRITVDKEGKLKRRG